MIFYPDAYTLPKTSIFPQLFLFMSTLNLYACKLIAQPLWLQYYVNYLR